MTRLILPLVCLFSLALNASAETILYDSHGFESPTFTAGSTPVGQDASNPWDAFGGSPAAYVVQTSKVASGTQAVQGNGGGLNDGSFVFPVLGYTPAPGEKVRIQVDIARTLTDPVANSSPVYAIDIYDFSFRRTSRFGLIYRDDSNGIRAFVNVPNPAGPISTRPEFFGNPIAPNTFVHFDVYLDYTAKTVTAYLNNNPQAYVFPFNAAASTNLDSAELQVGTFNNVSTDKGWFDNYIVSVVPEPSSISIIVAGMIGLLVSARRGHRKHTVGPA